MKESDWCSGNTNFLPNSQPYMVGIPYMQKKMKAIENMLVN